MPRMVLIVLLVAASIISAQNGALVGTVQDSETGIKLAAANVFIQDLNLGTHSRSDGRFKFEKLSQGSHRLVITFIGYKPYTRSLTIVSDSTITIVCQLTASPLPLTDVTVSMPRYETTLRESALPLGVVSEEALHAKPSLTVANALSKEPGLSLQRDGIWSTGITIRGMNRNSIVTLMDGNRIDTATDLMAGFSMLNIQDIERIEVIKGAASSLYGSGALGGVVNIISKDGWYQEQTYVRTRLQGGYHSANDNAQGYASVLAGSRYWYGQLSFSKQKAGDMQTPSGVLENSQYRDDYMTARVGIRPFVNHELKFNYQKYTAHDIGIPGGAPLFPNQAQVRHPIEKRELVNAEYIGQHLTRHLARISLKAFSQYILRDVENIPNQVSNLPASGGQPPKRVSVLKIKPGAEHDITGAQLQTDWLLSPRNLIILGFDAWEKKYDGYRTKETRIEVLDPLTNAVKKTTYRTIGELPLPDASYRSMGVYLQNENRLVANKLQVNLGGRIDQIDTRNDIAYNPLYEIVDGVRNDQPAGQTILWEATSAREHSWSANLGLLYHISSAFDVTMNLAQAFRAPSLEERYQFIDLGNLVKVGDPDLAAENSRSLDLGFRLWSEQVRFSCNGYYNRLTDLVAETPGTYEGRKALLKVNIGDAEFYGGDMRLDLQPFHYHAFWLHASYVHGQDLDLRVPLPQIAPFNGSVGVHSEGIPWFSVDLEASLFAKQDRVAAGELETPGYTVVNAYLNSKVVTLWGIKMNLTAGVENLLDKEYRNHLSTNRGEISVEPGRSFLLNWKLER